MSRKPPHPPRKSAASVAPAPAAARHDEWLLDEAGAETFPASDAEAATQPGGSLAVKKLAEECRTTMTEDLPDSARGKCNPRKTLKKFEEVIVSRWPSGPVEEFRSPRFHRTIP